MFPLQAGARVSCRQVIKWPRRGTTAVSGAHTPCTCTSVMWGISPRRRWSARRSTSACDQRHRCSVDNRSGRHAEGEYRGHEAPKLWCAMHAAGGVKTRLGQVAKYVRRRRGREKSPASDRLEGMVHVWSFALSFRSDPVTDKTHPNDAWTCSGHHLGSAQYRAALINRRSRSGKVEVKLTSIL